MQAAVSQKASSFSNHPSPPPISSQAHRHRFNVGAVNSAPTTPAKRADFSNFCSSPIGLRYPITPFQGSNATTRRRGAHSVAFTLSPCHRSLSSRSLRSSRDKKSNISNSSHPAGASHRIFFAALRLCVRFQKPANAAPPLIRQAHLTAFSLRPCGFACDN